ncbi:hypothetical protein PCASD_05199 [Puccinia coronata f. sp. avenae]|uniref:Uncharacterized protein n=1 Tax=Puccinia coronata f. sp. avenae TaxID=200324 RepID=A0A2N5TH78_9BASI|nr:hypothetical protein PCASD_05199 [Puccinia coronata f. sp. avenae]
MSNGPVVSNNSGNRCQETLFIHPQSFYDLPAMPAPTCLPLSPLSFFVLATMSMLLFPVVPTFIGAITLSFRRRQHLFHYWYCNLFDVQQILKFLFLMRPLPFPSHPDTKDHCTPHRSNNFNRNPSSFRPFTQFHIRHIDPKTCPILTYTSYSLLFATFTRCSRQLLDMPLDAALGFSVLAALGRLILAALGSILLAALGSILLAALRSVYSLLPETTRHAAR